jgi:putative spermidine/putrescine transport system substrate-binding protein
MQDKQFIKEMLTDSAHAYKEGRMDRRTFLALCGASGFALNAVLAGDAQAAADHVVMWNWGGQSEEWPLLHPLERD